MAKYTVTVSADGDVAICQIDRRRADTNAWQASVFAYGTFGSGTLVLKASPDGGTTKVAMKDFTGTAISGTAAYTFNTQPMGNGSHLADFITIYVSMSGSSSPAVTVALFDNR